MGYIGSTNGYMEYIMGYMMGCYKWGSPDIFGNLWYIIFGNPSSIM